MPRNFGASLEEDVETVLIDTATLQKRVAELGAEISKDYDGKLPVLIGVLSGAAVFTSDLMRCVSIPIEIDFVTVRSYGLESKPGEIQFVKDVDLDLKDRHVIVVEDIIDTGKTLKAVGEIFMKRGAASFSICALLDKKARRVVDIETKYIGFECPDEFVIGYGLDYALRYRNLPYVGALKRSVWE